MRIRYTIRGTHTYFDRWTLCGGLFARTWPRSGHSAPPERCLPHQALPSAHSTTQGQDGGPGGTPPTDAPPRRTGPRVAADRPTTWSVFKAEIGRWKDQMILADGTPMPTQARPLSNEQAHSVHGPAGGRSRWVFRVPGWPLSPIEWDVRSAGQC